MTPKRDGERLDGLGEFEPVDLAHEVDDVAARAAAEAVVEALVAVHGEGGRALVVERAEPLPGAAGLLQRGVVADDLDDVRGAAQLGEDVVVDVEVEGRRSGSEPSLSQFEDRRAVAAFAGVGRAGARRPSAWPRKCSRRPSRRRPVPWPWMTRRRAAPGQQRLVEGLLDGVDGLVEPLCR